MTKSKFIFRLVAVMVGIALFQLFTCEMLVYQVIHPTLPDLLTMLTLPGPILVALLSFFFLCVYLYIRRILTFFSRRANKEPLEAEFISSVQDRASDFPYFMAAFAYPFWMFGSALTTWIICRANHWPDIFILYGFLGGAVSSLVATPVAIYGYSWPMLPVMDLSVKAGPGLEPARSAGRRISVMTKLAITVLSLVIAASSYIGIISYKQTQNLYENTKRMEELLTPSRQAGLVRSVEKTVDNRAKAASYFDAQIGNLRIFYFATLAVAVLISLILSFASAHAITRPLRLLIKTTGQVQAGNYTQPVQLVSNDELAQLGAAFNRMMETIVFNLMEMEAVVEKLKNGVGQIDSTVATILGVSTEQFGGSAEQAAALAQTSSIAQQIANAAREIEQRAKLLDEAASSTMESCQDGEAKLVRSRQEFVSISGQMEAIQQAMTELGTRFKETYRIVDLIRDIAEKTEILALNASIEAAGAGSEGRRFRVVAEETRRQALRSAEAMKQIKDLVSIIQQATLDSANVTRAGRDKVEAGGRTLEDALAALKTISNYADSTLVSAKDITQSTVSQSYSSEQLARSVTEISAVARQIEQGSKQINAAITGLRSFAESLRATVAQRAGARKS